jgi:CheY-like chemotaxis protein
MGLGLAICRRLIEMHHGTIGVISSGEEGAGSTFYFTLPIINQTPAVFVPPPGDTILLLENAESTEDTLADELRERAYAVVQHPLTDDIAAIIHQLQPKAIIVNGAVSAEHGWEHLREIRENQDAQDAPILFHALNNKNHLLLELDHLTKPLQPTALQQALYRQGWQNQAGDTKIILIVDDDPGIREMHAQMLHDWSPDYQLVVAGNGREALDKLQVVHPDLILLDLMMPEMDGFKLLEHLRDRHSTRHIPVIVITAHTLNSEEMARLNRGVATIMSKGMFTPEETITQIEQALARSRKMGTETQRLVRRAMAFIHTHYAEPLAREDIARHVSVSEDYLTRCFKQETGISPIAYLNRYRVNQAKLLLEDSGMSMSEIAAAVGFTDNMHFSRAFRRESAMTPTEYRAKYR